MKRLNALQELSRDLAVADATGEHILRWRGQTVMRLVSRGDEAEDTYVALADAHSWPPLTTDDRPDADSL